MNQYTSNCSASETKHYFFGLIKKHSKFGATINTMNVFKNNMR